MNEVIEFPHDYDSLVRLAQQAIDSGDTRQAQLFLEKAYQLNETVEVNLLLVQCLRDNGKIDAAKKLASEKEETYLEQPEFTLLYIDLLLQAGAFFTARKAWSHLKSPREEKEWLLQQIEQSERFASETQRWRINKILTSFEGLVHRSVPEQVEAIQQLEELPYPDLIQAAEKLAIDPSVHPLVRGKVLETLVYGGVKTPIDFITIDHQEIKVIPASLPLPERQEGYLLCQTKIAQGQTDPTLAATVLQELSLQAALTYPIFDRFIESPEWWVDLTMESYRQQMSGNSNASLPQLFEEKRELLFQSMAELYSF